MASRDPAPASRLARVNPTGAFVGTLVLMLLGVFLPGIIGGAVLLAVAAGAGWLLSRGWAHQRPAARLVKVLILALVVGLALSKLL